MGEEGWTRHVPRPHAAQPTLKVHVGAQVATLGLVQIAAKGPRVQPEHGRPEKLGQRHLVQRAGERHGERRTEGAACAKAGQ